MGMQGEQEVVDEDCEYWRAPEGCHLSILGELHFAAKGDGVGGGFNSSEEQIYQARPVPCRTRRRRVLIVTVADGASPGTTCVGNASRVRLAGAGPAGGGLNPCRGAQSRAGAAGRRPTHGKVNRLCPGSLSRSRRCDSESRRVYQTEVSLSRARARRGVASWLPSLQGFSL